MVNTQKNIVNKGVAEEEKMRIAVKMSQKEPIGNSEKVLEVRWDLS